MGNAYDNASLIVTPNAYKASKIYSLKPTDGTGDLAFSRAGSKMVRNSSGLWETIGTNIPPLHYPVGGGCPSWLFEAEATNIVRYSTMNNAYWYNYATEYTPNAIQSPFDGVLAPLFTPIYGQITPEYGFLLANNTVYTISFFIKRLAGTSATIRCNQYGDVAQVVNSGINLNNATITSGNAVVTDEVNGWYRYSLTFTSSATGTNYLQPMFIPNGTVYVMGGQVELGSTATSPIITAGSSVTRLADVSYTTGLSALIGQTEGTLFIDLIGTYDRQAISKTAIALTGGATNIRLDFYSGSFNLIALGIDVGAAFTSGQRYKIAIVYTGTSLRWFINGSLFNSYTVTPSTFSAISMGNIATVNQPNTEIKDVILYKTALSDSEAIELTTL